MQESSSSTQITNENNKDPNQENCLNQKEEVIKKEIQPIEISEITMMNVFKLLYKLIIQNAKNLIIDYQSELFKDNRCYESDVVTIINSFYSFIKDSTINKDKSGFSLETVNLIYQKIEEEFNINGCDLIYSAIDKYKAQEKSILELIDSFVKEDHESGVLSYDETHGTFKRLIVSGTNYPIFVYESNYKTTKFFKIPGIIFYNIPRNIIILSKYHQPEENFDQGFLFHRDYNYNYEDYAVKSLCIFSPSFNHFFFKYLITAYWNDRSITDDFIQIINSEQTENKITSIFHVSKSGLLSIISFCPSNKFVNDMVCAVIRNIFLLLPSFPNSIIFKNENPLCVVDFTGVDILNSYKTKIFIIDENDPELPIPYPLNKATLDFAFKFIHKIDKENPSIWFSITGENFYYKEIQGREALAQFSNPDVNPNIKSVFDPKHPSHLVLFVDKNFKYRPENDSPLSWLPLEKTDSFNELYQEEDNYDKESNEMQYIKNNQIILNISSQIISDIGEIERSFDLFFITLSGGYPTVSSGYIPDYIQGLVDYEPSEENSVKRGMHHLIKYFSRGFVTNQILTETIPLREIGSSNHWDNYPINDEILTSIINEICNVIKNYFNIKEEDVQAKFIGHSMILLQIRGLPDSLTNHQISDDIWNNNYQPCKADHEIREILNNIHNFNLHVTEIIHEQSIRVRIFHNKKFGITRDDFINYINEITSRFGFFKLSNIDYIEREENEIIGYSDICLINTLAGISFASTINDMFTNINSSELMSLNQSNNEQIKENFISNNKNYNIRQLFPIYFNEHFKENKPNILIFPTSIDACKHEMLQAVTEVNKYSMCIDICGEPKTYLPQCLYLYSNFPLIFEYVICKECLIGTFKSMKDLQNVINPKTNLIDRKKMVEIDDFLPSFFYINTDLGIIDKDLLRIPFVQGIWTLMNSDDMIFHYIKMWFTLNMSVLIRTSPQYFISCPLHKETIYRTPKKGNDFMCPKCNAIYHSKCHFWHFADDECPKLKENEKRCPYCLVIAEKVSGCNHIACRCQKHWCFQCEHSPIFDSPFLCYLHMKTVHNEEYYFQRNALHIYFNPKNKKEIVKLELEVFFYKDYLPNDEVYYIRDFQDENKLQIESFNERNLLNHINYSLPIFKENTYDYDSIIEIKSIDSSSDFKELKLILSNIFDEIECE